MIKCVEKVLRDVCRFSIGPLDEGAAELPWLGAPSNREANVRSFRAKRPRGQILQPNRMAIRNCSILILFLSIPIALSLYLRVLGFGPHVVLPVANIHQLAPARPRATPTPTMVAMPQHGYAYAPQP